MPDDKNNIYLYEAFELRAEYNSSIETLKNLLPEAQNQDHSFYKSINNEKYQPIDEFNVKGLREEIKILEIKKRKLNNEIQKTNFNTNIEFNDQEINLAEALELRKSINEEIKDLSNQLTKAAYRKIIYKEDRDIVEEPDLSFVGIENSLKEKRLEFRELNRKLRKKSFETLINYQDEK
jgi:ribosomal protein S20